MRPDAELLGLLNRAFPECRIEKCEELNGGISARAVVVDLTLVDGADKRVVVRRPTASTPEEALGVVTREYALLSRLAELGFPAPRPNYFDASDRR